MVRTLIRILKPVPPVHGPVGRGGTRHGGTALASRGLVVAGTPFHTAHSSDSHEHSVFNERECALVTEGYDG